MTPGGRTRGWVVLAVALSGAFALLAHAALIDGLPPKAGALLSLVPLAMVAMWALRRNRGAVALGGVAVAGAIAAFLGWPALERHFPDLFFLEHAGGHLTLAFLFGRTLYAGREPLCTTFARIVHGHLPPEVERYSRKVTLAWTIFFVAIFGASCALYLGGFVAAWSLLANILSPLLVGAMFAVEYFVRHRVLPDWERIGILGGIRAFSRHFAAPR